MILTSTSSSFTSVQSIWERGDRTAQQSASRVSLDLDQLTEGRALVVGGDRRFRKGKEKEFWFLGSAPVVRAQHSLRQIFFFPELPMRMNWGADILVPETASIRLPNGITHTSDPAPPRRIILKKNDARAQLLLHIS